MRRRLERVVFFTLLAFALIALPGCLGCGDLEVSGAAALRDRFPQQAARVLNRGAPLVVMDAGFALEEGTHAQSMHGGRSLRAIFPRDGGGLIRFELPDGFTIQVSAPDVMGDGTLDSGTVIYSRPGGASFWTATEEGFEEWLMLEKGQAFAGNVVAFWDVSGATLREEENAIYIADERGISRIRVTAPEAFAADGREVNAKLSVNGARIELTVDAGGDAVLVDPAWTPAGILWTGRYGHEATLLSNGQVLITGGHDCNNTLDSVEVYDPTSNQWIPRTAMSQYRDFHQATLLPSGKVLVAGGIGAGGYLMHAEIYDPSTNTWSPAAPMNVARSMHVATQMSNGKVLVTGGENFGGETNTAEIYNPADGTWTPVQNMILARRNHTATELSNGMVLVTGGYASGNALSGTEAYDPATNTWYARASLNSARASHEAVMLDNGHVLVAGGFHSQVLASAEVFNSDTNTWTQIASMSVGRSDSRMVKLQNGKALITGGWGGSSALANAELFDPSTSSWTPVPAMNSAHNLHTATLLLTGEVLVAGSWNPTCSTSAELFKVGVPGDPCATAADCPGIFCADGVCCNTICDGPCRACSVADGAAQNGICSVLTGAACDDGNACTPNSTCDSAGACTGIAIVCPASDQCHEPSTCDTTTGLCGNPTQKPDNTPCNDGSACTSADTCQSGVCVGGAATVCPVSDQCHLPSTCNPATGLCSNEPKGDGAACDDGSLCTTGDACYGGVCVSGSPTLCNAIDECHDPGVCNPGTGQCTTPIKSNGTACNDEDQCTQVDTCQNGVCTGAAPKSCPATDQCHDNGTCDPATGNCSNPSKPNGAPCNDLNACTPVDTCQNGLCGGIEKICPAVDQCHDLGVCNPLTGDCSTPAKQNGTPCSDGTLCTQEDACQGGACVPGPAVVCTKLDGCHEVGLCNPQTGVCSNPLSKDGAPCDDGSACTQKDSCQAGTCAGTNPIVCQAPGQCQAAGICDPISGNCLYAPKADGSACDDGDKCTQMDSCQAGLCQGNNPTVCAAQDQCHDAGTCDPATGQCSNPAKQNDTPCDDDNKCTINDTCQLGKCAGPEIACPSADACHIEGICNPATGECANTLPDGAACDDGDKCTEFDTCQEGVCSGAVPVVCDPPDSCHNAGVCNPSTGMCEYASNGEPCPNHIPIESSGGGCACRTAPAKSDLEGIAWVLALFAAGFARRAQKKRRAV